MSEVISEFNDVSALFDFLMFLCCMFVVMCSFWSIMFIVCMVVGRNQPLCLW